jgi:hypothetical protein
MPHGIVILFWNSLIRGSGCCRVSEVDAPRSMRERCIIAHILLLNTISR